MTTKTKETYPIFFDPLQTRWKVFLVFSIFFLITTSTIFTVLIINIVNTPQLPDIRLNSTELNLKAPSNTKSNTVNNTSYLMEYKPKMEINKNGEATKTNLKPKVIAFYVNWDDRSFLSLKQNISKIDTLMPEWLHLQNTDPYITVDDQTTQTETIEYIQSVKPDLKIIPLINNYNSQIQGWDDQGLRIVMSTEVNRRKLVTSLLDYVKTNNFNGINIDFENVPIDTQYNLQLFMKELYTEFKKNNLEISQDLPLNDYEFNYKEYAKYNDYIVLMAYDEYSSEDIAGPIASQYWFYSTINTRLLEIPANKVIISLGSYGYDWQNSTAPATNVTFQDIMEIAQVSNGHIYFSSEYLNPYLEYIDKNDTTHKIWYLDSVTVFNQVTSTVDYNPYGYAMWRLGSEDPSVWSIMADPQGESSLETLRSLNYGYGVTYKGEGEIIKVIAPPQSGLREITYDKEYELIIDETISKYCSPYVISKWGQNNTKKIALTFDDGPDDQYTSKILDILQRNQVKGTFFVIGANAESNPTLVKKIYDNGNEIGSHTFTHPNIARISKEQLTIELNATQRVLENILGKRTLLFRPPYGEDGDPTTIEQVKPLETVGNLGYYTVGMKVDPKDWSTPGVNYIVESISTQVDKNLGNVVLLHDSGGNRQQTIEALPLIIYELKSKGYEFVTVSELLGLTRDTVMPESSLHQNMEGKVGGLGFTFISLFIEFTEIFFVVGIILGITRFLLILWLAIMQKILTLKTGEPKSKESNNLIENFEPKVAILIPAFNEEKVIVTTINQVLKSDYKNFEVIIIDDGSTDNTYSIVEQTFRGITNVKLLHQANGGKSSALNFGASNTNAEILIVQDGDTLLKEDAVSKLVPYFKNRSVGAVAGNVKVGNRNKLLTKLQALEYIISQNMDRRAFAFLNCITVVPGAIGAWKTDVIKEVGGFESDTLAEDAELTLRVLKRGYLVSYADDALAYTEAPENMQNIFKQRFRWVFGTLQSVFKHKEVLFNPKYKFLGLISLPNVLIFQLGFNLIAPILDIYVFLNLIYFLWQKVVHTDISLHAVLTPFIFYIIFLAIDMAVAIAAFIMEKNKEDSGLLLYYPIQRIIFRLIIYIVSVKSLLIAIKGQLVGWGKFARTANCSIL